MLPGKPGFVSPRDGQERKRVRMEQSPGINLIRPQEIMQENLVFLREYARLLLIEEDETLTPVEDFKDVLMQEFMAMGTYLKLTERDMMLLLFKDILSQGIHLE